MSCLLCLGVVYAGFLPLLSSVDMFQCLSKIISLLIYYLVWSFICFIYVFQADLNKNTIAHIRPSEKDCSVMAELRRLEGPPTDHHNYRNRTTCMHGNRKPCNSF